MNGKGCWAGEEDVTGRSEHLMEEGLVIPMSHIGSKPVDDDSNSRRSLFYSRVDYYVVLELTAAFSQRR